MIIDSLRTTGVGISGSVIMWVDWLPLVVRMGVGIATFVYLCVKIYKEIKN